MSKSIYEEALLISKEELSESIYGEALLKLKEIVYHLTPKQWLEMTSNIELIRKHLQQAYKQEQLLKLYKEYFEYSEMLKDGRKFGGRMLVEHERDKIIEEIKELEKEIRKENKDDL